MAVYVDKNKIKQELLNKANELEQIESFDAVLRTASIYMALLYLELAKSEDVAPVVHAHWEDKREDSFGCLEWGVCSHCKNLLPALAYCGFCGAKMDEEVDNEQR